MTQETLIGLVLAFTVVNFLGLLWVALRAERRNAGDALVATRISLIEQSFNNAPTHRDLQTLTGQMHALSSQITGLAERLSHNTAMTQTIQQHLLEAEKK